MKSIDIILSMLIIIFFAVLFGINKIISKTITIEKNWSKNRCNPIVMPFVSLFGHDAVTNFKSCIQMLEKKYMAEILAPYDANTTKLANEAVKINDSITITRNYINQLRDYIEIIVTNIYGVILNLLIEIQRTLIMIKNVVSKMTAVIGAISYSVKGLVKTGESVIDGPPGELVKSLSTTIIDNQTFL